MGSCRQSAVLSDDQTPLARSSHTMLKALFKIQNCNLVLRMHNKIKKSLIMFPAGLIPSLRLHQRSKAISLSFWFLWLSQELTAATHVPSVLGSPGPGKQESDVAQRAAGPFQGELLPPALLVDSFDVFSTVGKCQLNLWKDCAINAKTSRINISFPVQFLLRILLVCPVRDLNLWINNGYSWQKNQFCQDNCPH